MLVLLLFCLFVLTTKGESQKIDYCHFVSTPCSNCVLLIRLFYRCMSTALEVSERVLTSPSRLIAEMQLILKLSTFVDSNCTLLH